MQGRPKSTPLKPAELPSQNVLADFIADPVSSRPRSTGEALRPLSIRADNRANRQTSRAEQARQLNNSCESGASAGRAKSFGGVLRSGPSFGNDPFPGGGGSRLRRVEGRGREMGAGSATIVCSSFSSSSHTGDGDAPIVFTERGRGAVDAVSGDGRREDADEGSDVENGLDFSEYSGSGGRKILGMRRLSMPRGAKRKSTLEDEENNDGLTSSFFREDDYVNFGNRSSRGVGLRSSRRASLGWLLPGGA